MFILWVLVDFKRKSIGSILSCFGSTMNFIESKYVNLKNEVDCANCKHKVNLKIKLAHSDVSELKTNFLLMIQSNNLNKKVSLISNKLIKYKISKQYCEKSMQEKKII